MLIGFAHPLAPSVFLFLLHLALPPTHPAQLVLALGAGVHEGLGDDGQRGVHHLRHVHIKGKVRVLQDVHPEPQWEAAGGQ